MRTIRFPEDVDLKLQELAHAERSSINRTVVVAVERYIRQMQARRPKADDGR